MGLQTVLDVAESAYDIFHNYPSVFFTLLLGAVVALLAFAYIFLLLVAPIPRPETASEKLYRTVISSGEIVGPFPLPKTADYSARSNTAANGTTNGGTTPTAHNPPVYVSVIVPAYNESLRLPLMLSEAVTFLSETYPYDPTCASPTGWEILIVDDGSTDRTSDAALKWMQSHLSSLPQSAVRTLPPHCIRVVSLERNRGKGGAVTHGMRHFRGEFVVFADADGATKFSDLSNLLSFLQPSSSVSANCQSKNPTEVQRDQVPGVAVGSRAHMVHTAAVVQRSFIRNLLMYTFHTYLAIMGISAIKDTQCGFKLFSRAAALTVFKNMHSEGWIFDVEVLLIADREAVKVIEVPVSWHEVEGTKMSLGRDSIRMAWDLLILRVGYAVGVYGAGR